VISIKCVPNKPALELDLSFDALINASSHKDFPCLIVSHDQNEVLEGWNKEMPTSHWSAVQTNTHPPQITT
jgi:hypothetical protein